MRAIKTSTAVIPIESILYARIPAYDTKSVEIYIKGGASVTTRYPSTEQAQNHLKSIYEEMAAE